MRRQPDHVFRTCAANALYDLTKRVLKASDPDYNPFEDKLNARIVETARNITEQQLKDLNIPIKYLRLLHKLPSVSVDVERKDSSILKLNLDHWKVQQSRHFGNVCNSLNGKLPEHQYLPFVGGYILRSLRRGCRADGESRRLVRRLARRQPSNIGWYIAKSICFLGSDSNETI